MPAKIQWVVAKQETGRYASFHKRGWPFAHYKETGQPAVMLQCVDSYNPSKIEKGEHGVITMFLADHSQDPHWKWLKTNRTYTTLAEAKAVAEVLLKKYKHFAPKPKVVASGQ